MPTARSKKKHDHDCSGSEPRTDWVLIENLLRCELVRTMYLFGPPGIGKTFSAYHALRDGEDVYAVTLTEDTPAAELRGHYVPKAGELVWSDGPFTAAMRSGSRLVLNEVSHAAADVLALLYPVLESFETARLTLPTNETVRPAPGFHVVCTDNASPRDLPEALQDRFDCTLEIADPHPNALAALSPRLRRAARRSLKLDKERRTSLRRWLAVQRLEPLLGLKTACIAVFGEERGQQLCDAIELGEALS